MVSTRQAEDDMAHQCPRCELKFRDEFEVKDHLTLDHGMDPQQIERHYAGGSTAPPRRQAPHVHTNREDNAP